MARMISLHSLSSNAEIKRRAQFFYEEEGCPSGRELAHWLRAEAEFRAAIKSLGRQATAPLWITTDAVATRPALSR